MSKSGLTGFSWWTPRAKARHRVMPMNGQVRAALLEVIQDRKSGRVFDYAHTGVSESTLRRGFRKACKRAGIPFGQNVEGGLIWHDLRRTFANRVVMRQVHEYDISDLLGHTTQRVYGTYARSIPEAFGRGCKQTHGAEGSGS